MLERGAKPDAVNKEDGSTAHHDAAAGEPRTWGWCGGTCVCVWGGRHRSGRVQPEVEGCEVRCRQRPITWAVATYVLCAGGYLEILQLLVERAPELIQRGDLRAPYTDCLASTGFVFVVRMHACDFIFMHHI